MTKHAHFTERYLVVDVEQDALLSDLHDEIDPRNCLILGPEHLSLPSSDPYRAPVAYLTTSPLKALRLVRQELSVWLLQSTSPHPEIKAFSSFEQLLSTINDKLSTPLLPLRPAPAGGWQLPSGRVLFCPPFDALWWQYPTPLSLSPRSGQQVRRFLSRYALSWKLYQQQSSYNLIAPPSQL